MQPVPLSRRGLLRLAAPLCLGLVAVRAAAAAVPERSLALHHLSTGESLRTTYYADGRYLEDELRRVSWLLRDWRAQRACAIDPKLVDYLWGLRRQLETTSPLQVVCGYRTPQTNAMLRRGSEAVARNSFHLQGRAIDLKVPGRSPAQLRQAAISLKRGGVGYYPQAGFVHLDTGRVRAW